MGDAFLCGGRQHGGSPFNLPASDSWKIQPSGDRTCSYCGSLHPDDLAVILEGYVRRAEGFQFDATTKPYKVYARRPGVQNASQGGIKFYTWHLPPSGPDLAKLQELYRRASERWRLEMAA